MKIWCLPSYTNADRIGDTQWIQWSTDVSAIRCTQTAQRIVSRRLYTLHTVDAHKFEWLLCAKETLPLHFSSQKKKKLTFRTQWRNAQNKNKIIPFEMRESRFGKLHSIYLLNCESFVCADVCVCGGFARCCYSTLRISFLFFATFFRLLF